MRESPAGGRRSGKGVATMQKNKKRIIEPRDVGKCCVR